MRLAVNGLRAGYGSATIIEGLDLTIDSGTTLALVGRNGMGKSTLLKALLGLLRGTRGSVRLDDTDVSGQPTNAIIHRGVAYAPQEEAIFGELTIADNLAAASIVNTPSPQRTRDVLELFPVLGQRLRQRAGTLSGGEQRMLTLARVLLAEPKLLIIDEISAGLQPAMIAVVERALRWERETRATTILMVEQNLDLSLKLADRVAVMKLGRIIADRAAKDSGIKADLMRQLVP